MLPPSKHKSGGRYEVVHDAEPAALPEGLLEFIEAKAKGTKAAGKKKIPKGVATRASVGPLGEIPEHIAKRFAQRSNIPPKKIDKPPPVEVMRDILLHLNARNCFAEREEIEKDEASRIVSVGWLECGMALKLAYGDEAGFDLWAITHVDKKARTDAPTQWASFATEMRAGDVTIATIIKAAKDAGFPFGPPTQPASADSSTIENGRFTGGGDVKNGKVFASMFRNKLLHVHETNEWLLFDAAAGWVSAPPGEADCAAKETLEVMCKQAAERFMAAPHDPIVKRLIAHVARTSDAPRLRAMIDMATSEPGMTVQLSEFDDDPMLLGVTNGVLDLKKRTLLPVCPEVLVSKRCNVAYEPSAKCPRFEKFMLEVQPDADVRGFLQRLIESRFSIA